MEVLVAVIFGISLFIAWGTIASAVAMAIYWVSIEVFSYILPKELPDSIQIILGIVLFFLSLYCGIKIAMAIIPGT